MQTDVGEKRPKKLNDPSFDISRKTVACILTEGDKTEKYKNQENKKSKKENKKRERRGDKK